MVQAVSISHAAGHQALELEPPGPVSELEMLALSIPADSPRPGRLGLGVAARGPGSEPGWQF
jgi:hypothetical protein